MPNVPHHSARVATMCGIYGMISLHGAPLQQPQLLDSMRQDLVHRGPDGHGRIERPYAALGVNRLRIVDRSSRADQPFVDPAGCVWLALNGEIYNAGDLRRRFARYPFRSASDAEAVVPLFLERGPDGIEELDGMFALAIWDDGARRLTLARDRAGEKPLFVRKNGSEIWFASEIQALLHGPDRPSLDRAAFGQAMQLGYPLEPATPFEGIRRVRAGTIETMDGEAATARRYWAPGDSGDDPEKAPPAGGLNALDAELERLLVRAVDKQLAADVPVGIFASGGLDSSLLVGMASRSARQPLRTFSVGFDDRSFDERPAAHRVAQHFGTSHVAICASHDDLAGALFGCIRGSAEPVTDPAVLPTRLLASEARNHVGVVLCGEGADELFGGYPTYQGHRLAHWFARLPAPVRSLVRNAVEFLPSSSRRVPLEFLLRRFVQGAELPWLHRHIAWFGTGLPAGILSQDAVHAVHAVESHPIHAVDAFHAVSQAMRFDYSTYLRDNLLVKIDRATMLESLESRAPYLDPDLTRFAWSLPASLKVKGMHGKWLLRRMARRWLPSSIRRGPKRGMSVPLPALLGGRLAKTLDRVLEPARLAREGLLNPRVVGELVGQLHRGRYVSARGIWTLLVWQLWLDHWIPGGRG